MKRIAICAVALVAMPVARAQLADCAALGAGTDAYKVVIDDLSLLGPAANAPTHLLELKERLAFNLSLQLGELRSDLGVLGLSPVPNLGLVTCNGRKPSMDGTEFSAARVESLSDQRVVVELWGTLMQRTTGTEIVPVAMVGYVIPPILHYRPEPTLPGRFMIEYPKSPGASADVLQKLPEASAFALVGVAIKARRARRYDLAVWAFTRGAGRIAEAQKSGDSAELRSLLSYVTRAACDTREAARNDTANYSGPISLTPRETCGGAP